VVLAPPCLHEDLNDPVLAAICQRTRSAAFDGRGRVPVKSAGVVYEVDPSVGRVGQAVRA